MASIFSCSLDVLLTSEKCSLQKILHVRRRKKLCNDSTVATETANLAQCTAPDPSFISLIECTTNILKSYPTRKAFQSQWKYFNSLRIINIVSNICTNRIIINLHDERLHQREVSQCKYLLRRYIMRCKVDHSPFQRALMSMGKKSFGKLRAHPHLHFSRLNCITKSLRS